MDESSLNPNPDSGNATLVSLTTLDNGCRKVALPNQPVGPVCAGIVGVTTDAIPGFGVESAGGAFSNSRSSGSFRRIAASPAAISSGVRSKLS